jgi:glycosyltransferase involved in cell wall biosynthesis
MTAPLRVLQLAANRWWTGSADPIIQISRGLAGLGHEVTLGVIPGDRFEVKARAAGLELLEGLSLDPRRVLHRYAGDVRRLRRIIAERRIDIVHTHHSHDHWLARLALGGLFAGGNAAGAPMPVLVRTVHNRRALKHGWLARRLWARTHGVIAVSRGIGEVCRAAGIDPDRLWTIGGIVDIDRFTPSCSGAVIRREFDLGDRPVVGSVSRLAPNRGHELLLSAFQRLLKRIPAARLLLVGKGENRGSLEHLARDLDLSDSVIFTGYRDGDLGEVLAALDCFVLPGVGSDESCRAALEAMAVGKPVVAPPAGALPETIVDGETGRLVTPGSHKALEEAMRDLLSDAAKARMMGAAGRRRVVELFSPVRRAREMEECYEKILRRWRR